VQSNNQNINLALAVGKSLIALLNDIEEKRTEYND
jgi:hypothetical protein